MEPKLRPLPSTPRLLAALALFSIATVTGIALALNWPWHKSKTGDQGGIANTGVTTSLPDLGENEEADFFYDSIGRGPELTDRAVQNVSGGASSERFTLELKVTADRESAEKLIDVLHQRGLEAYYTPLTRGGRVVYRIRQGIFASDVDAHKAALAVEGRYQVPAKVVKLQ